MTQLVDPRFERECTAFLCREAELLDAWKLREWLDLLSPDVDYRIPVRTTRMKKDGNGFSRTSYLLAEDLSSLKLRVKRLESDYAWSANPRTRTRHMIANIRVARHRTDGDASADDQWSVASNIAVYCHRGDEPQPVVLTGERQDVLVKPGDEWKLRRRLVLLDSTVLGMDGFSIFL